MAEYTSPISGKKRQLPSPMELLKGLSNYYQSLPQFTGPGKTPLELAQVGDPMILGGRLGYKGADGAWQPRGDMESEDIPTYDAVNKRYTYDTRPGGLDLNRPKPFAMNPEGQFERYFKTPEMDQYFGAASRGKGAPVDAAAMDKLASGKGVPEGTGIATKYRAESAMGQANIDEIVDAMGYKGTPMEDWARANKMLAFREYNKKFPAGEPTIGPTPAALQASEGPMTAFGQEVKTFFPGAEPGADADMERLEGEELIDAYNMMRSREASSKEPVSKRVGAFLGQYGDLGALTK